MVGQIVEYTDGLRNSQEHTIVVRGVSQIGACLGLLASVPVTLASVPFTYPSYLVYDSIEPDEAFVLDMLLLPSFTLLEIGSLLGAPADLIERLVYKAWVPPDSMTAAEQEAFENDLDEDTLPRYPVTPILPLPRR